nr:reverse transcriptase domain-containing protein [Tanacetum cinerariifolium]
MRAMANTTPLVTTVTKPVTNPRDADATPRANIQDFCEEYYEDILPIIMDKVRHDKRKEVHARLDFGESSRERRTREDSTTQVIEDRVRSGRSRPHRLDTSNEDCPKDRERFRGVKESYDDSFSHSYRDGNRSRHMKRRRDNESPLSSMLKSDSSDGRYRKSRSKRHRSTDEDDLTRPWMCEEEDPFTLRIRNFVSSRRTQMPNNVKTYDGTGDPEDHVKIFQAVTQVKRQAMPTWCHMFNSTLIGAARVWFDELPPESADSYKDLKVAFLTYFMQQKKYVKDPVEIHNIKQNDGETIEDFMERFKVETERMKGALNTMEEMMITTTAFIRGEAVAASKKKGHTSWKAQDQSKRQTSEKRSDFRGHPREGRGSNRFTPLTRTPKEILTADAGHSTDECMQLKKQIEELVRAGKLSHLIKEIKHGRDQLKTRKKETPAKDKPTTIYMIQSWQMMTRQKVTQSFKRVKEITFPPLTASSGVEGPLVIEAEMGGHMIHRMFVDEGSSMEILYEHCFNRLHPEIKNQMVPATTSLTSFSGKTIWPLGQLRLLTWNKRNSSGTIHSSVEGGIVTIRTDLSEMELKKILIENMEGNKSIQRSDEQQNLYKEGPSAGSDRGSKRQKEGGEHASASTPSETATGGAGRSTTGSQSRQLSASKSAFTEEPVQTTCQMEEPPHSVFETGADDQPIAQTSLHPKWFSQPRRPPSPDRDWNKTLPAAQGDAQSWISDLARQTDARSSQIGRNIKVYVDDLVVKSYTEAEMQRDIDETFRTLRKINMKLNPKKSKRLRRYFQAHPITGITDQPIKQIMSRPDVAGRLQKWSVMLGEHNITYRPRTSIKGQILVDFLTEMPNENPPAALVAETQQELWTLFTDGSSCVDGSGAGVILTNPEGIEFSYALRFQFAASNNEAEYEALMAGLRIAVQMGVQNVHVSVDSKLVANQVLRTYVAKEENMIKYLDKVKSLVSGFTNFSISQVPRRKNKKADALSKIVSTSFVHLSKQVLVEILKDKSIKEKEVTTMIEDDGPTWMTPIVEYLKEGTLPSDRKEARKLRIKARQYELVERILYRRSFLTPWLRYVGPLQAEYVIREIHEGSCSMHAGPRSVVAKAIRLGYYWPTMHRDARDMIRKCND